MGDRAYFEGLAGVLKNFSDSVGDVGLAYESLLDTLNAMSTTKFLDTIRRDERLRADFIADAEDLK